MKTHEFAEALILLSEMLKAGPNVELKNLRAAISKKDALQSPDIALSLQNMIAMSKLSKNEWRAIILEWRLPVEVKLTDSVRDLLGRVLRYLEDHPDELEKIRVATAKKSKKASPEVLKALSILLGINEKPE